MTSMERQSSFGSEGSARSSASKLVNEAEKHNQGAENENANNGFTTALFGVLFTLAKEKFSDSWKIAFLTVVVDFLLILAIMLNLEYPWDVDPNLPIWKFFYMIEVHKPLSKQGGYKFYTVVFYLLSAMLYVCIAICVWVAWCFKNDSFPFLWPIKFARVVVSFFFGMFYIAALNIFLVMLECAPDHNYHGKWYQHIWHVQCFAMPHVIHLAVAICSSLTFAVAALLLVIADHDLEPLCKSLLAAPHSMCELKAQLAKTAITVTDVLLWPFPRVQGVVFAISTVSSFYFHLKELPYYTSWMNSFRLCFLAVHAWVGTHLCLLVFFVDADLEKKGYYGYQKWKIHNPGTARAITNSMAYGLPIVFFGAGVLGALRLYYFFRVALKFQVLQQQPNLYSKRVHRFSDEKEVEIVSRIVRVWDEDGVVDPQCLDLAEVVLRAGIQQFPKSPYLHIVYANLLIECRQQLQGGWAQMEQARRLPLNISYRFSIFTREQEHKQKAAVSSSGESAADLVSYVEFQRNYRLLQSYHKAALMATREFWRLLLKDAVNLNSLTSAFRKIEKMERLADRTYKVVLERYPKAVKLLRSYANFLETVKNDPWTAAQYSSEADKQEEALENAEHDMGGEDAMSMRNSAIVTINASGIIQTANKHAIKMLGYNKGELENKNISVLMPQPFSARHNTYMRNYVTTGKAKILDRTREVVALHRERYVFPIRILVTKTQGSGQDSMFMGLLKEVDSDPNQVKAWLMTNGVTLCADQSFSDHAGWGPNDLMGKPFANFTSDPEAVNRMFQMTTHLSEEELEAGAVKGEVMLLHKYAEDVPVTLKVEMGGTTDQRLLVLVMTRRTEVAPTLVFDHHGRALFANQALCSLLGMKAKDVARRDISSFMPQPFGFLHHRWIKDAEVSLNKPPVSSCRSGAVHSLLSSNGVHVPVRMAITSREVNNNHLHIVRATRLTTEEALDEQRLYITVDQHGHILSTNASHHGNAALAIDSATPEVDPATVPQTFGFASTNLVGRKLHEAIDIFMEWHDQGHSVMHAVKALAQRSTSQPGSAWRVGVVPHNLPVEAEKEGEKVETAEAGAEADNGSAPRGGLRHQTSGMKQTIAKKASLVRRAESQRGIKAAIMQITGPEHTPEGTHYNIRLWRPELLSGVLELSSKMTVIKADTAAGLIFGVPAHSLNQQPLTRFLKLEQLKGSTGAVGARGAYYTSRSHATAANEQLTVEALLGNKSAAVKGGMKGKVAHRTGPRRQFEARHADGMPLSISLQAAMKNGTSTVRLMALIKPLNLIKGNVAMLHAIMSGEDMDLGGEFTGDSTSMHEIKLMRAKSGGRMKPAPPAVRGPLIPKLKLSAKTMGDSVPSTQTGMESAWNLHKAASGANHSDGPLTAGQVHLESLNGSNRMSVGGDPLATNRTDQDVLATARDVELAFGATPRPDEAPTADLKAVAHAGLTSGRPGASPSLVQKVAGSGLGSQGSGVVTPHMSDDSAMARSGGAGLAKGKMLSLAKRQQTHDWEHVEHVDPDEVAIPHDADYDIDHHCGDDKDMAVSSSASSDDSDGSDDGAAAHAGVNTEGAADKMTKEEALQRKRTMANMEPSERAQYVHGVRRVKEWLASGYQFDMHDAVALTMEQQTALAHGLSPLGGAWRSRQLSKVDEEAPLTKGAEDDGAGRDGGKDNGLDPDDQLMTLDELAADMERQETLQELQEGEEADAEDGQGGYDASRAAMHGGVPSASHGKGGKDGGTDGGKADSVDNGMNRGRRLKRLLKLLSGQKAHQGVSRLRLHILIVIGSMLLVHAICFVLLIVYINKQKNFTTEISAAGEAIDRAHYMAMYARAIEASTRSAGFEPSGIPDLGERLDSDTDRLMYLHQGLYLGFKGLKRSPSEKLNDLWDEPQWNATVYQDTKTPSFKSTMMTLWNLGGDFISAAREVAYYATNGVLLISDSSSGVGASNVTTSSGGHATNVTLPQNRHWLFVRANVGESLYTGYLRVLNTLLLLAQDNIAMLKLILIVLLLVEGCVVCCAAIGYVFWLLWKVTRARAALFTVFLVVPQGQIRSLASRHITTSYANDESDDEDDKEADGKQQDGGGDDAASDGASVISGAATSVQGGGGGGRRSFTSVAPERSGSPSNGGPQTPRKPGITFNEQTEEQNHRTRGTVLGRIKRAMSGDVSVPQETGSITGGPPRRFYTRKRLTHTTSDIKHLAWPFFLWGALICVIYLFSYLNFAGVELTLVNLKMFERSMDQAARVMYYTNELALDPDPAVQAALQPMVREEAAWLDTVYSTTLYGGPTLEDGLVDGARDKNTGSLFRSQEHASMLFEVKGCMRDSAPTCLSASDPFYQVSRNAIDPMMRRLMREATLLSLDDPSDVNANSSRWQYVWRVAQEDLHDGLEELVTLYRDDSLSAFRQQGTLHTVVFAISWVLWAAYLWLLLKPYLQASTTETKRVAELLSQLPADLDVEGMVEESWLVVADTQLDRSGMSVWDPKNHNVASLAVKSVLSTLAAVRLASQIAARRFSVGGGPPAGPRKGTLQADDADEDEDEVAGQNMEPADGTAAAIIRRLAARTSVTGADPGKAAGEAAAAAKKLDTDSGYGELDSAGTPTTDAAVPEPSAGGDAKRGGLSATAARGSPEPKPPRGAGGRVSPLLDLFDSARVPSMSVPRGSGTGMASTPHSEGTGRLASPSGTDRRGSLDRVRRASMERSSRSNKVVPAPIEVGSLFAGSFRASSPALGGLEHAAAAVSRDGSVTAVTATADAVGMTQRPVAPLSDVAPGAAVPQLADELAGDGGQHIAAPAPRHFSPSGSGAQSAAADQPFHGSFAQRAMTPPLTQSKLGRIGSFGGDTAIERAAAAAAAAASSFNKERESVLPGERDDVAVAAVVAAAAAGSVPQSPGGGLGSVGELILPPPPPMHLVRPGSRPGSISQVASPNLSRLGLVATDSRVASPIPVAAAAANSSMRIVDRRFSLDAGGGGSRPMSPRPRSPMPSTPLASPGVASAAAAGSAAGVTVVSRRTSLDAGRPASRLGGLAPGAGTIALPPAPSFSRGGSATVRPGPAGPSPLGAAAGSASPVPAAEPGAVVEAAVVVDPAPVQGVSRAGTPPESGGKESA